MKTVVLVGLAGRCASPPDDADIWVVNRACQIQPDAHRVYALDPAWLTGPDEWKIFRDTVNKMKVPVVLQKQHTEVPLSEAYPLREVLGFFNMQPYFTSTIAYMIADAIRQGYQKIIFHRIMSGFMSTEYYHQKPCIDFWAGIAIGRGVKVMKSEDSRVGGPSPWDVPLYGYMRCEGADAIKRVYSSAVWTASKIPVRPYAPDEEVAREFGLPTAPPEEQAEDAAA